MDIYSQNKSIYFEYDIHENSEQSDNSWLGINYAFSTGQVHDNGKA